MKLSEIKTIAHWWNFGKKTIDFVGTLDEFLIHNKITYKKVKDKEHPDHCCYVFKTCHRVTLKHFGSLEDGAFHVLKLYYATMGDKAIINVGGRIFTINH